MKNTLILIIGIFYLFAASLYAQTCNPTNTSGCPSSYPGTQGSTTPVAITGTGYTENGVTTASIDTFWGVEYNHSVCPWSAPVGGNQSSCDISVVMPHEAPLNPNNYEALICIHGGGGWAGGTAANDCFASSNGPLQRSILYVQTHLGEANALGKKGIVIILINYRETINGTGGQNNYYAQWQDVKCATWTVIGSSTYPVNKSVIGVYGPSWGGTLAALLTLTPDNQYTPSCPVSAPSTPPVYRTVAAWPAVSWFYSASGTFGNGSYDNVTLTCAYQNALIGQMYLNTDPTITGHCPSPAPPTIESTIQAHCSGMSPSCDPAWNIRSTSTSVLNNSKILFQFGTPSNNCATGDCLVMPYWNTNGITTGTTGGAAGGNLYNVIASYAALGIDIRPYAQILYPAIIHEGDASLWPSPSQIDALNLIMHTPPGSSNLNGTLSTDQ